MSKAKHEPEPIALDDKDPWRVEEYGGKPIIPRVVGEDEDFARISLQNFIVEPAVWLFAGFVLHGNAWKTPWDLMGYWMVLFVMLPLRLMDTDKKRDRAFRIQYVALQALSLGAGYLGWRLAGG
ncbi:MAG TPA: hypothetical protein VGM51_02050 [Armatimonadota bacterium]|jgi:hypothetical protein